MNITEMLNSNVEDVARTMKGVRGHDSGFAKAALLIENLGLAPFLADRVAAAEAISEMMNAEDDSHIDVDKWKSHCKLIKLAFDAARMSMEDEAAFDDKAAFDAEKWLSCAKVKELLENLGLSMRVDMAGIIDLSDEKRKNLIGYLSALDPECDNDEAADGIRKIYEEDGGPHVVFEAMCVRCLRRWICVCPVDTKLKDLECECGKGVVIMTGQSMED